MARRYRNGNNRVSLLEHFEQWKVEHQRAHDLEREAVKAAASVVDERLINLNNLRTEVLTDRAQFARKDYAEHLDQRISALEGRFLGVLLAFAGLSAIGAVGGLLYALLGG